MMSSWMIGGRPGPDPLAPVRAAVNDGRPGDALQAVDGILATSADAAVWLQATQVRAELLVLVGRWAEAISSLQAAREEERAAGRPANAAVLGTAEAQVYSMINDLSQATIALISAANDFGAAGDTANQIRVQLQTAVAYATGGQPQTTRQIIDDCLRSARKLNDPGLIAEVLYQDVAFHQATGQGDAARALAEEGLQAADRSPNQLTRIQFRVALGPMLASSDPLRMTALLSEAEGLAAQLQDPGVAGPNQLLVAQGWKLAGRVNDSLRCAQSALNSFRAVSDWVLYMDAGLFIADLYGPQARQHAQEYIDWAGETGGPGAQAEALTQLGQLAYARGDQGSARADWQEAVNLLQGAGIQVPQQLSVAIGNLG